MPCKKRGSKTVTHTEHNDDDDFVSKVDNKKRTRNTKSNELQTESNISTRQPPRKRSERLSKIEQQELDLALQISKETVPEEEISTEILIISDDKENTNSSSTTFSDESKTITAIEEENDEQRENSSRKTKRIKIEEEGQNDDENESHHEEEDEIDEDKEEEEEEEPAPPKKSIRKTEETTKNCVSKIKPIDINISQLTTRGQQKSSVPKNELIKKKSNAPLGFPTGKIMIPSLQVSRVGLSRKTSVTKPLHPNLNQRVIHE